jgi:hypothetical protein
MKFSTLILLPISLLLLSGCLSSRKIQSFECSHSTNGEQRLDESIAINPVITTHKGIELVPRYESSTKYKATSKKLKEYQITVVGGKRRIKSNIIDVDQSLKVNKRVQVFMSVRKKPSLKDTIDFYVDYQGKFNLNFNVGTVGENAEDVYIDVKKIYDESYYEHFACDVYLIKAYNHTTTKIFYMSEMNTSLFVSNRGGAGYNGPNGNPGENGANGRDGGIGSKGRNGRDGENGGNGGDGGNGGNSGRVILTLDSASVAFTNLITVDNGGGRAGRGGAGGVGGAGGAGGYGGERMFFKWLFGEYKSDGDAGLAGYNGYDGKNGSRGIDGTPLEIIIK